MLASFDACRLRPDVRAARVSWARLRVEMLQTRPEIVQLVTWRTLLQRTLLAVSEEALVELSQSSELPEPIA